MRRVVSLAKNEANPEVRSCLAASCKRWKAKDSIPILTQLIKRSEDIKDKHIPLLLWWAIENKAASDREKIIDLLDDKALWKTDVMQQHLGDPGEYPVKRRQVIVHIGAMFLVPCHRGRGGV